VPKEDAKPEEPSGSPVAQKTKKIFVGGLAPTVDEKALREYFDKYGEVEDAVVMYDHENKRPRGFGFISFASEDSVEAVFAAGPIHALNDKPIEIKPAVPRDQLPPARKGQQGFYPPNRMYGGRGPGGYPYNGPMYGQQDYGYGRGAGRPPGGPGFRPPYGPRPGGQPGMPGGFNGGMPFGQGPAGSLQLQQLQQAAAAAGNIQHLQQLQAAAAAGLDKQVPGFPNPAALSSIYNMQSLAAALPATTSMMSQPPANPMYSGVNNLQQLNGVGAGLDHLGGQVPLGGVNADLVKQLSNALALSSAAAAAPANPGYTSPEANGFSGPDGSYTGPQEAMNLQQAATALQQNPDFSRFTGAPGPGWSS
jgi:hypothetical protein